VNAGAHNHLTREVRPEGDCPGCDERWHAQRAVLAHSRRGHDQTDALIARADVRASLDYCAAVAPADDDAHTCDLKPGHRGRHHCPRCHRSWSVLP